MATFRGSPCLFVVRSFRVDKAFRPNLGTYGEDKHVEYGRSGSTKLCAKRDICDCQEYCTEPRTIWSIFRVSSPSPYVFHTIRTLCQNLNRQSYTKLTYASPVRDTIGTAIYFSTYESSKQLLVKLQGRDSPTAPSSVAIAGGLCGVVSWVCVRLRSE